MKQKIFTYFGARCVDEAHSHKNRLRDAKKSFTFSYTGYTADIRYDGKKYSYAESLQKFENFGIMRELKKQVKANMSNVVAENVEDVRKINYFDFADSIYKCADNLGEILEFEDVVEIDIVSAYSYTLFNAKLIDKAFFDVLQQQDKRDRLKIIGSLATRRTIEIYEKGKIIGQPVVKVDTVCRKIFFYISRLVDEVMLKCYRKSGAQALFYFVDGLYLKGDDENVVNKVIEIISAAGYRSVFNPIKKFQVVNEQNALFVDVVKKSGAKKSFSVPKKQVIKYYINK